MSFTYTYDRTTLQQMQATQRKEGLIQFIEYNITVPVLEAAKNGKTQYFWTQPVPRHRIGGHPHPNDCAFTNEELIDALKEKFPETTVEYQETWVDVRPGVKEQKKGILIDWS